jgi:hypothetical protein
MVLERPALCTEPVFRCVYGRMDIMADTEFKECRCCHDLLPLSAYPRRANGTARHQCVSCESLKTRLRRHKVSIEWYTSQLDMQDHRCAICKVPFSDVKRVSIDHDHSCCENSQGRSCGQCKRGLLCTSCNAGIGMLKEDPEIFKNALLYLTEHDSNA